MEHVSVFTDKTSMPTDKELADKLESSFERWKSIHDLVLRKYPGGFPEWNYPGKKYGWSFRIKDKKRAIIYLLPRERYFKVAFVYGDKAVNEIMQSNISNHIKIAINQATKYAAGRGISFDVLDDSVLMDIEQLIDIKLHN